MPTPACENPSFRDLLQNLATLSADLENGDHQWPEEQLRLLGEAGVLGWVVPKEYGGTDISPAELIDGYVQLASVCLTTTFVLTQRNGACLRIAGSENASLKADLLPALVTGDVFATVGISHLTTSRQHLAQPAMRVEERDGAFVFNGTAPWVTGAKFADYIVTGGTCSDARQLLVVVPTDKAGMVVHPPPRLLALNESQTGSVALQEVALEDHWRIAGPVERVMQQGRGGGAGSLTTSALAIGAAQGTLRRISRECEQRPDLLETYEPLADEHASLSRALLQSASGENSGEALPATTIRARANSLVLRVAQASLTAAKGAGFIAGHPAERALREAAFFLVWSCPQPVQAAALKEFACVLE